MLAAIRYFGELCDNRQRHSSRGRFAYRDFADRRCVESCVRTSERSYTSGRGVNRVVCSDQVRCDRAEPASPGVLAMLAMLASADLATFVNNLA